MKKQYFCIIDTETTQDNLVVDFGAVIVDRLGKIHNRCAVLINGIFNNRSEHPLFCDPKLLDNSIWAFNSLEKRYANYNAMLNDGRRMLASVHAINKWLAQAVGKYDPVLTAYNLAFDADKCGNTQIDLNQFSDRFCLWQAASGKWGKSKKFRKFILETHGFNNVTKFGNMTYKTNAEVMARFVLGNPELEDEPHTALEDVIDYELPILAKLTARESLKKIKENAQAYSWRDYQVKDAFKPA